MPLCKSSQLRKISRIVANKLMMESYKGTPGPCTSMKIIVAKDVNDLEKKPNDTLNINVIYPVEYTEIKQEKVKKK